MSAEKLYKGWNQTDSAPGGLLASVKPRVERKSATENKMDRESQLLPASGVPQDRLFKHFRKDAGLSCREPGLRPIIKAVQ